MISCARCRRYRSSLDMAGNICVQCLGGRSRHLGDWANYIDEPVIVGVDESDEICEFDEVDAPCVDEPEPDIESVTESPATPVEPQAVRQNPVVRKNARKSNPKYLVRQMTAAAIRRGEIPPISDRECERCGQWAEEYHHCSYTDPDSYLDVMPLCVSCHNAVHLEQGGNETFFSVVRRSDR